MLCFNINPVLHAKFTQFRIVCKPQTHDPRTALNLNLLAQTRKSRNLCCCACDHAGMNSSNPGFLDAFFPLRRQEISPSLAASTAQPPLLLSHWTAPQSQTVSPCGVAIEDVRHLNETDRHRDRRARVISRAWPKGGLLNSPFCTGSRQRLRGIQKSTLSQRICVKQR